MDLDKVAFEGAFEWDDGLDEQWIGVFKVDMHDAHHAKTHKLGLEEFTQLRKVVGFDGSSDKFGLLAGTHRGRFDILDNGHICTELAVCRELRQCIALRSCVSRTVLFVDLSLDIEVDAQDDHVGEDVKGAHAIENVWVIEGDLLGDLHKPSEEISDTNHDKERSRKTYRMMTRLELPSKISELPGGWKDAHDVHLRVDSHCGC